MPFAETLNFDDLPTFTKAEVATHQLERALHLFLEETDYVCAITLAGACEEILGKLLEKSGKEHSLKSFVKACVTVGRVIHGEEWSPRVFVSMANEFRDGLKHYTDGHPITVPREAAVEILNRAIENYWQLTEHETPLMRRFMEEVHGC
uniref:HEPN domain-containing protein n=1 Tax=Dechloromonas aromatica (strain RCB) TaxID=159087 RepID=Q47CH7_DECAR